MDDRSHGNPPNTDDTQDSVNTNIEDTAPDTDRSEISATSDDATNTPLILPEDAYLKGEDSEFGNFSEPHASQKPKKEKRHVPLSAFVASLLAVVLVCGMFTVAISSAARRYGYWEGAYDYAVQGGTSSGNSQFSELDTLDEIFKAYSYNDLSDVDFLTAVLKAYVEATGDLYAEYYTREEYEAMTAENAGEGVGIGVSVIYSQVEIDSAEYTVLEIITVFPDSPAEKEGLEPGDLVFYVGIGEERELVQSIGYTDSLNRIRGEKGTAAELTVLRPQSDGSYKEVEFSIIRDEYKMQSVSYRISETDPSVGIVKILQFDLTTPPQFIEAMDALTEQGIEKFVFDVRNNPGGDLKSIIAVLACFLEEGDLILSTQDNKGAEARYYVEAVTYTGDYASCSVSKSNIGKYAGYEMAILTNGNTASAAELFTAALRDYDLAKIVGTTTYGKGSMQSILTLDRFGVEGALKLTTRHYFPPCGEGYDGIGIAPDIEAELSEEASSVNIYKLAEADDDQLQAALSALAGS